MKQLLQHKTNVITEILDESILQNQLVKPSEILRLIAIEGRYKWVTDTVDTGDGIHRCALGAIYGYFGWKGWKGVYLESNGWKDINSCIGKTVDIFRGDREECITLGRL